MSQQEVFKKLMERRADAKAKRDAKLGNAMMQAYKAPRRIK